jgi:hypothetical protein
MFHDALDPRWSVAPSPMCGIVDSSATYRRFATAAKHYVYDEAILARRLAKSPARLLVSQREHFLPDG